MSSSRKGGRRWVGRVLLALAIASVVVGVSILLFNQWLGSTDRRPDTTTTSATTEATPSADQVPLGVEATDDGSIRIYVPRCPSSQVTTVGWTDFSNLGTLWAIDRKEDGPAIYEFTVGVAPPGFSTYVELTGSVDDVPDDVTFSFVATRTADSGDALPAATASVRLDELSVGSIRYRRSGEPASTAASVDEFQAAVGC